MPTKRPEHIVIFDGVCNLCNSSIDFITRHDKKQMFYVSANQHEAGAEILREHGLSKEDTTTVFYLEKGKLYQRSTAALRIARHLGFPWNLLWVFIIIPPFIRDGVYKWISRNRYRWFGKKDSCRLPTPEEQARFL
jgi:predicted DCC family thiol-disulfide oxidoreductase YuxK